MCESHIRIHPFHAQTHGRVLELVCVQILRCLSLDVIREIVVDLIGSFVVDLALDRAIGDSNDMSILSLWVEHYTRDRILLCFDCYNKLITLVRISS